MRNSPFLPRDLRSSSRMLTLKRDPTIVASSGTGLSPAFLLTDSRRSKQLVSPGLLLHTVLGNINTCLGPNFKVSPKNGMFKTNAGAWSPMKVHQ